MRVAEERVLKGDSLDGVAKESWEQVAFSPHRLLILDYDGTLAPFSIVREGAFPLPGIPRLIKRITATGRTEVAVVSGRPIIELEALLPVPNIHLIGEHGWESRRAGHTTILHPLPKGVSMDLALAEEMARSAGLSTRLERKRTAVVLHTRGLPVGDSEPTRFGPWEDAAFRMGLLLRRTDGGLELRAGGRNKGTAVRELVAACPTGTLPVYLGDDETDEDAFREVLRGGFGIRVGPSERASFASGRLPSCPAVRHFLARWYMEVEGYRTSGETP